MTLNEQIAKQLKDLFLTGQWIGTNLKLKAQLDDVDLEMANARYESLNSIALLAFHLNYGGSRMGQEHAIYRSGGYSTNSWSGVHGLDINRICIHGVVL